jgi:hypothetical protein
MNQIRFAALALVASLATDPATACSPAPSCWIESGPAYLKDVCKGYARDHRTASDIEGYVEEPEKVGAFVKACGKLGIHIAAEDNAARAEPVRFQFTCNGTFGTGSGMAGSYTGDVCRLDADTDEERMVQAVCEENTTCEVRGIVQVVEGRLLYIKMSSALNGSKWRACNEDRLRSPACRIASDRHCIHRSGSCRRSYRHHHELETMRHRHTAR